jgi:hypothetical protein
MNWEISPVATHLATLTQTGQKCRCGAITTNQGCLIHFGDCGLGAQMPENTQLLDKIERAVDEAWERFK